MRSASLILFFLGCQPMEAGNPLEAVALEVCECPACPEPVEVEVEVEVEVAEEEAPVESVGTVGDPFAMVAQETIQEPQEAVVADPVAAPFGVALAPSWGVRLVSVVPGASPPQAILGLSDGSSQVVTAGDLLPAVGIVVIAIGKDRVQLAQVKPAGDHAVVESIQLSAMYPASE
jgi:hypothetical protein